MLRLGDRTFPVDEQGRTELWYPGTLGGLTTIRFDRLARAALTANADPALAALVRQSPWVMIGDTQSRMHLNALRDIAAVPSFILRHTPAELHTIARVLGEAPPR